jgi:hypothetical protein
MNRILVLTACVALLGVGCRSARDVTVAPSLSELTPLYVTDELTEADRESYAAFLTYMTAHAEQRLWDSPPEKQAEMRAQFQRLYPPQLSPAFVCHMTTRTNSTYMVYVEAQQYPGIPDQVHIKTHIVSTNSPWVVRAQEFSAGWRTSINGFAVDRSHHDEFGDLLRIDITTGLPMNAGTAHLYLTLLEHDPTKDRMGWGCEPELVLIRMEGDTGQIGFTTYGKTREHLTRGPIPSFSYVARTVDDWREMIYTRNRVQLLAALFYLAGSHVEPHSSGGGVSPHVLAQFDRENSLYTLTRHKSPWIRETAKALWESRRAANKTNGR